MCAINDYEIKMRKKWIIMLLSQLTNLGKLTLATQKGTSTSITNMKIKKRKNGFYELYMYMYIDKCEIQHKLNSK